jgi:hypothetical protein
MRCLSFRRQALVAAAEFSDLAPRPCVHKPVEESRAPAGAAMVKLKIPHFVLK